MATIVRDSGEACAGTGGKRICGGWRDRGQVSIEPSTRRFIWALPLLAVAIGLGGCSTAPLSGETDALTAAVTAFKAEVNLASQIPQADADLAKVIATERLVQGAAVPIDSSCGPLAAAANTALSQSTTPAAEDAAYRSLRTIHPCGSTSTPGSPGADQSDAVFADIDQYFGGLAAIIAATDTTAVKNASTSLTASATTLGKDLKVAAPIQAAPGFAEQLVNLALATAQYMALKEAVLEVDPLLDPAAPSLIRALRLRQGLIIQEVAQDAATASDAALGTLNGARLMNNSVRREAAYDRLAPSLDDLTQQLLAAQKVDPADVVHKLVDAHHKLAAALKSDKGQAQAIFGSVISIVSGAQTVLKSAQPAAPAKAAKPAAGG